MAVGANLSIKLLRLDAEVQRQCRKKGMRVMIIRMVMNLPPASIVYKKIERVGGFIFC